MARRLTLVGVLLFFSHYLFAGDVATFVNLGFSSDSKYFMFGEYGVNGESKPYASIYGVNVPANVFVPNGVQQKIYNETLYPGENGLGALMNLFGSYVEIAERLHVDHLAIGRELYLLIDGTQPQSELSFRDFLAGNDYLVRLKQTEYGSGTDVSSSDYIDLTIKTKAGRTLHYLVGNPNLVRRGVENYRIRQILLAPDDRSLVFVIEKHEVDKSGFNVRYMVETVRTGA